MQFLNNQDVIDNNGDLIQERPIGWSSACLDSTIDYYINFNSIEEKQDNKNFDDN
uniref:Uncharacterized protein n=1 Tax=Synarthrophyton chejuense TaxID=2485825 RepID=A0A3G3MFJ9_9FLOR|nr:hypothetical protein [Synarthrophyton chejuense]AYR05595.1 hypothetical protein [Synarthrophyton chejuense]